MNGNFRWIAGLARAAALGAAAVLALAGAPAQAADAVEERLDAVEMRLYQLEAQVTVLAGKIDALYWLLVGGFGFLGLVILFQRERPRQGQSAQQPLQPQLDSRALDALMEQAVRWVLAQGGHSFTDTDMGRPTQ